MLLSNVPPERQEQKPYISPEIIYEMDLETRAGSPLGSENFEGLPIIP